MKPKVLSNVYAAEQLETLITYVFQYFCSLENLSIKLPGRFFIPVLSLGLSIIILANAWFLSSGVAAVDGFWPAKLRYQTHIWFCHVLMSNVSNKIKIIFRKSQWWSVRMMLHSKIIVYTSEKELSITMVGRRQCNIFRCKSTDNMTPKTQTLSFFNIPFRCQRPDCNIPLHRQHRFPGLYQNDSVQIGKYAFSKGVCGLMLWQVVQPHRHNPSH